MLHDLQAKLQSEGKIDVLVRVRPLASRSSITGILEDGSMKVEIAAPAEGGKGNGVLAIVLGEAFGVGAARVKILSGKSARLKLVRVTLPH